MKKIFTLVFVLFCTSMLFSQPWLKKLPSNKSKNALTFYDYKNAFNSYWAPFNVNKGWYYVNGVKKKAIGWKQFKRWEYDMENKINPSTGAFPSQTAQQVYEEYRAMHQQQALSTTANWTNLGSNSSAGGYNGIGRITCIAFHPTDNNTYWVGAASGGLWVTTNNGTSWTCLTDNNGVLAINDIIVPTDYATSNTIYIATGDKDGWDNNSIGVLKSTNGGTSWATTGITYALSSGSMVNRLLIDPNNNQTLLAATSAGVYKTTNGGTTWSTQLCSYNFIDMEYKPGDFNTLYGSTYSNGNSKIYVSSNGGTSWAQGFTDANAFRIELAVSANQPTWVYALISASDDGLYGVYKSTNSGVSYTQVYAGTTKNLLGWNSDGSDLNTGQGFYDLSLAVSPTNASTVLVGGINTWKSTTGGTAWTISNHWSGNGAQAVHGDKHTLKFRADGSLFECNDGGVYISTNTGTLWTDKTNGMVISQMYKLSNSQTVANEVITGLQDNGTKLLSGGTWSDVKGGDGMECLIDYSNVNVQYGTYTNGQIDRTTDHWVNATDVTPASAGSGAWVTPYIIDPTNSQTLYAGYADVWKTTNRGTSWTKISTMNTAENIRSMAIAPSNTQVLYVAAQTQIWKTLNGGTSWTDITGTLPVSGGNLTYVTVKNDDPNTLWVTLSGYTSSTVYQSSNGGTSWTNISAGLPALPAYSIVQNKQSTSEVQLYVGTELGIYFKKGTANWVAFNTGLPNVKIGEIEIYYATLPQDSKLRAATYGRGLWESNVYYNTTCTAPTTQATAFTYSAIANNTMTLGWTRGNGNAIVVVAKQGSAVNSDPVNGTAYTAGAAFGSGTQIGTGNYVVYNGTGTSVNLTGLTAGATYYFAAYENATATNCYKTPGLTGNATTTGATIPSCDTLSNVLATDTLTLYGFGTGQWGSWTGHNSYSIAEYAEYYTGLTNPNITGLEVYVFDAYSGGTGGNHKVTFNVYAGGGTTPGAVLGSKDVFISALTPLALNYVQFTTPIVITGTDVYVGYTIYYNTPADTFSVVQTQSRANLTSSGFMKYGTTWQSYPTISGNTLYSSIVIGPIVCPSCSTPATPTVGAIVQPTCALATGSVTLSGLPATGTWTITRTPGGTTTTGTGTSTTISGIAAGTFTFTVSLNACTSAATANVVINAQPSTPTAPTLGTITQPTCALATGGVILNGLPATGTWTLTRTPGGNTTTGTGTTSTITGLAAGTYTYTVTNASNCTSVASANIVINAQPTTPTAPTVGTITQPTCALATGSVILNGLPATGTWTLTRTPGGTTTTGTGTTSTISGLAAGTYTYTVTNASSCTSVASANIVINAQPITPVISNQTTSILTGTAFNVSPTGAPVGTTYSWTTPTYTGGVTGGVAASNQTSISGTLSIPSGNGTATYTVTPTSGTCVGATFTVTVTVSFTCIPVSIGTQPLSSNMCVSGTDTLSVIASGVGPFVYQWQYYNGTTWGNTVNGTPTGAIYTNATSASLIISGITSAAAYQYRCYITNCSGANNATSNAATVTVNTLPSAPTLGTLTQPTCVLATGGVVLNGLPATGTWSLTRTPGGTITTGSGVTSSISGLATGTYTYTVTNSNGCTSSASSNIVINAQPSNPTAPTVGTITQPTCIVTTGSVILNGLPASGTWTLTQTPGGGTITGSGASYTISGLATGTYTYTVTNASLCTSAASGNVVVNAPPTNPSAPIVGTITQPSCTLATGSVLFSGLPATGTWTLTRTPGGNTTTGAGITSTISGLAAGTYTYTVTNAAGCTSVASSNIVINAQPSIPTVPTVGPITQTTCTVATGSVFLYDLPATGNWTITQLPGGSTTTGTGTGSTITGLVPGTYTFTVTNSSGCVSSATTNIVINSQPIPPTPIISQNGLLLSSNAVTGNQWYNASGSIVGSTNQNYTVTANGSYYVIVTVNGCSSSPSNTIVINNVGIETIDNNRVIKIYPNPVNNELSIEIVNGTELVGYEILNYTGQLVYKGNLVNKTTVQTAGFAAGVYLIKLENGKTFEFKKIFKE